MSSSLTSSITNLFQPLEFCVFLNIVIGEVESPVQDGLCVVSVFPDGVYPNLIDCPNLPSNNISPVNGCSADTPFTSSKPASKLKGFVELALGFPADAA